MYRYKKCECCNGTGKQIDDVGQGKLMRQMREEKKISLRFMAYKLGWSAPFLSDLELGRRRWNEEKVTRYEKALA